MTKTVSTDRLDSSIFCYRDHVVIPRKIATTYTQSDGSSKTDISYGASFFDDGNRDEGIIQEIGEYRSLDGAIRIAKLEIDLSIEKYQEWIG